MLEIKVFMNSSVEEVLAFKCCNLYDQNMEIHLRNVGDEPIRVPSCCDLVCEGGEPFRIETLFPHGMYTVAPGEILACYCTLSDEVFSRYQWIVFQDTQGREHRALLTPTN